jgi:glutamate/tyrosine decarboxylase-like PLP-dependent enzyme
MRSDKPNPESSGPPQEGEDDLGGAAPGGPGKGEGDGSVPGGLELSREAMRALGYHVVDLLVERWSTLEEGRPWQMLDRTVLERLLREPPPEHGRDAEAVLQRAVTHVLPHAARVDHPRFFAFIPGGPTWPSVLADMLTAGFNTFQGTWLGSSGPSQVELVVLEWFRTWLRLPEGTGGLFTSGGSAANLMALIAAREAAGAGERGMVYVGDQGHSSILKGAVAAGFARDRIRTVPSDREFRMDPAALAEQLNRDRGEGFVPVAVCAAAGATNTGAVDPLQELSALARDVGAWFHVDAAYGGFAVLDPGGRYTFPGIEKADSVTLDPHKWFYQPFETGCLLVRSPEALHRAFRVTPEYLQDTELGSAQINFGDRGIQLSRRFRALRVWMSVQMLGLAAFRDAIGASLDAAEAGMAFVSESPVLRFLAPPRLGILCFQYVPDGWVGSPEELDALNQSIQDEIVGEGTAMISSTRLAGRFSLRMCVLNYRSRESDVLGVLQAIEKVGASLSGGDPGRGVSA